MIMVREEASDQHFGTFFKAANNPLQKKSTMAHKLLVTAPKSKSALITGHQLLITIRKLLGFSRFQFSLGFSETKQRERDREGKCLVRLHATRGCSRRILTRYTLGFQKGKPINKYTRSPLGHRAFKVFFLFFHTFSISILIITL